MLFIKNTSFYLKNTSLYLRRLVLLSLDLIIVFGGIKILDSYPYYANEKFFFSTLSLFIILFSAALIYLLTGQYKGILKYRGSYFFYGVSIRNLSLTFIYSLLNQNNFLSIQKIFFFTLITFIQCGVRIILRDFIFRIIPENNDKKLKIVIYGAGEAGAQLATSFSISNKYRILAFIDDDQKKFKRSMLDIPIRGKSYLINNHKNIDRVFLAIPSLSSTNRKELFLFCSSLNLKILQIPSIDELVSGKEKIDNLRPISIEDILGRPSVNPNKNLLEKTIENNTVLITGSGGSIGGEIFRQVVKLNPKKLILLDNSEFNLYKLNEGINNRNINNLEIQMVLGNCLDKNLLNHIFEESNIDTVIHAAAYKHVPIVEENPINGILNNVFSTKNLCEVSQKFNPKYFLLISSDKAVRPTNYMGASKRLSELVVQAFDEKVKKINDKTSYCTIYTMVRFGNVLGSSGSVVPLFEKQISHGGPLTITHPEVTRYFMTINEAAQLVLQACSLAKGGETFLLDMGKPLLISELAKQMIYLSGKNLVKEKKETNDIVIEYTGLRKGEKLFEELLISGKSEKTEHPLIYSSQEKFISFDNLMPKLDLLEKSLTNMDINRINLILSDLVPEWDLYKSIKK